MVFLCEVSFRPLCLMATILAVELVVLAWIVWLQWALPLLAPSVQAFQVHCFLLRSYLTELQLLVVSAGLPCVFCAVADLAFT